MTIIRVFGMDPGGTHRKFTKSDRGTGWCLVEVTETQQPKLLVHGQVVGGPDEWIEQLMDPSTQVHRAAARATSLVCEGFVKLNGVADDSPLETIGMMKMYSRFQQKALVIPRPSDRNGVTHDDLKRIGWWPGGAGHADEAQAIRHVLADLMRRGHQPTMQMLYPPEEDDRG